MQALIATLLPAELSGLAAMALIMAAAFTSAVTAALGIGGGVMLLGLMAVMLPPAAIIPVQGLGGQSSIYSCCAPLKPGVSGISRLRS